MYVCGCLCVAVCQCAVWSVRWCGGLSWRSKGDAGGMVCHLPRHRIRMISHHLLGGVQNAQTHTHTHPPTRTHTRPHTDVHKHTHRSLEGRDEISSSSVLHWDLETQTWRPWPYIWPHDPGVQMHSRPPTHTQKCTPAHTCTLFFMTFLPKSKAMLCLMCHKCAYLNICALRKSQSSFFISNHLILGLHATLIIDAIKSWHVGTCLWVYGCVPPQCHHINQIRSTVSK